LRIKRGLDRVQQVKRRRIAQPLQLVALELTDTVFGGNRSAPRGNEVVDFAADRLAFAGFPGEGVDSCGRQNVKMDIAVAQVPKPDRRRAWKFALEQR